METSTRTTGYRGRIAPTPTGYLHLGHWSTFRLASQRARQAGGTVIYRNEDIDPKRCRPEFNAAAMEDLRWARLDWDEGPDVGGPFAPYDQSKRLDRFREVFEQLKAKGFLFPCQCSRRDVAESAGAPHEDGGEPIYPGTCRERAVSDPGSEASWRFRVSDGEKIAFEDGRLGQQAFTAGHDFGDFIVWRRDDAPAYELAVVVDDRDMKITEVVRGEDLLLSTARQILIYRALGWNPPAWFHGPLLRDKDGHRLAKRHQSMSLRSLRERGVLPNNLANLA
jgi:glutamyl-tRNA synthetase